MTPDQPDTPGKPDDAEERDAARGERDGDSGDASEWWVDRYVLYAVRESTLWALLLVVMAHFAAFIASAVLATVRTGHPFGVTISTLLVVGTAWGVVAEVRRKGRMAGFTGLLAATWLLSAVVAYVGDRFGLL